MQFRGSNMEIQPKWTDLVSKLACYWMYAAPPLPKHILITIDPFMNTMYCMVEYESGWAVLISQTISNISNIHDQIYNKL